MTRENFTQNTKDHLARAANFRCVRPGCQKITHSQSTDGKKIVGTAVASHDIPASPNGPGNNIGLTPEQIRAAENGAWLCAICARLVDHDRVRFPTGTISEWQKIAASYITQYASTPATPTGINLRQACQGAQLFCNKTNNFHIEGYINGSIEISWQSICAMESLIGECHFLGPLNTLTTFFSHTLNLQYRALDCLKTLLTMFKTSGYWFYDETFKAYRLVPLPLFGSTESQRQDQQSAMSYAWKIWNEFNESIYILRQFSIGAYAGADLLLW